MKSKLVRELQIFSKKLRAFIELNCGWCDQRSRKNTIYDAIIYRLFTTKLLSTQNTATADLNDFKNNRIRRAPDTETGVPCQ